MKKVSRHIYLSEAQCHCGCGQYFLKPPIVYLFDETREYLGIPIKINSAFRCLPYQMYLRRIGLKAATISPHCEGFALDMAIPLELMVNNLIDAFTVISQRLGMLKPRFGHWLYEESFLHVDSVYYGFKPYTAIENPKPQLWKPGAEW